MTSAGKSESEWLGSVYTPMHARMANRILSPKSVVRVPFEIDAEIVRRGVACQQGRADSQICTVRTSCGTNLARSPRHLEGGEADAQEATLGERLGIERMCRPAAGA